MAFNFEWCKAGRKTLKLVVGMVIFKGTVKFELHGFLDATVSGYVRCIYISDIVKIIIATPHPLFFFSQSSIAPIKTQTIPSLELQATLLLTKSMKNIYESFIPIVPIKSVMLLEWYLHNVKSGLCINRRVSEIRKRSNPLNWHNIISGSNLAGVLSKGRFNFRIK